MASQVEIYNLALGNIGSSDTVASLEERSKQRIVCNQYWELSRDSMLADFDWPFAKKNATLAKLDERVNGWGYAYQFPNDCLRALYMGRNGPMTVPEAWQTSFEIMYGDSGQIILTDAAEASLTYIVRIDDTGRFPPLFVEALAWKLASMIAMPLTNTRTITETAEQMYQLKVQNAWAAALNQQHRTTDVESEYLTARGHGTPYPWNNNGRGF